VYTVLHVALGLISRQAHSVKRVQFKVNGTDPYMAMVYLHIGLLQLIGYGAPVCVEYQTESCLSMQQNPTLTHTDYNSFAYQVLHSLFLLHYVELKVDNIALIRSQFLL
jgi:hypothetical protein